jgi:hypothetical protein
VQPDFALAARTTYTYRTFKQFGVTTVFGTTFQNWLLRVARGPP